MMGVLGSCSLLAFKRNLLKQVIAPTINLSHLANKLPSPKIICYFIAVFVITLFSLKKVSQSYTT